MTHENIEVRVGGQRLDVTDVEMTTESNEPGTFAALRYAMAGICTGLNEVSASFTIMVRKLQAISREARRREKRHRRNVKFKARRCATLILRSWQREGGKNPGRSHASIVRTVLREWRTLDARDGATR